MTNSHSSLEKTGHLSVVYLSSFPPRQCGIATFTRDLTHAMDEMLSPVIKSQIVAMNPHDVISYHYPNRVIMQIKQTREEEYIQAAQRINQMDDVQLVNIQHEFGLFGGSRGSHLLPFVRMLRKPLVIAFHTVLPDPDEELYTTVGSLAENASTVIVMTNLSKKILTQQYGISSRKIKVIPHGIHHQPFTSSKQAKMTLGYSDRVVLSTFGLLSRIKGLEYVIEALPEVVRKFPNFVYIIFGATHPNVLQDEGESYRNLLIQKIFDLGLYDHVKLYNKYFPLAELLHFLKATDIYISPSLDPYQAVSGTLSYALGTGRPVISTAFSHAQEVLGNEVGVLVDFKNPAAYTEAILKLLEDEEFRLQLGKNAYFRTRYMTWDNVALQYARVFSEHAPSLNGVIEQKSLPRIRLDHLLYLTDGFGIVQFAKLNRRDTSSGYTLDDNARALAALALYYNKFGAAKQALTERQKGKLLRRINTYLDFIAFVVRPDGPFQNFVNADKSLSPLNEQLDLDEANGRALYALALTVTTASLPRTVRQKAFDLLQKRLESSISFDSPRAMAHCIKALCILIGGKRQIEGIDLEKALRVHCDRLVELYQSSSQADWQWFESYLAYSNPVLPEALLMGYRIIGDSKYRQIGKTALDFLLEKSFNNGMYMPVGNHGWHYQNGKRSKFDQQPEEVASTVSALNTCYLVTKDEYYSKLMRQAFNWFLGENSLNQVIYDRTTGGCYDGVGRTAINLNQGAESTISYLLARLTFD
ncbi:MAG: glycosyltransferase family 4 protein [Dehalococcoidales bacterium]|nr:glycosyltransferase family 4 protein [Dehalococcoidales bacterium]